MLLHYFSIFLYFYQSLSIYSFVILMCTYFLTVVLYIFSFLWVLSIHWWWWWWWWLGHFIWQLWVGASHRLAFPLKWCQSLVHSYDCGHWGYVRFLRVTYTDPIGALHDFLWRLLHTVATRNVVPMRLNTKTVDMCVKIFSRVIGANLDEKRKTCWG
jgi:hypothetical protein